MPIRLQCTCGKVLSVRDELAGKGVKCPGCQKVLRVPGEPSAAASPTAAKPPGGPSKAATKPPATAKPAQSSAAAPKVTPPASPAFDGFEGGAMDDLFNEEGFEVRTGKTCPSCYAPIAADAVFCTRCGFNLETGAKVKAHVGDFDDPDSGEAILRKAAKDLEFAQKMQDKMNAGSGMPWWMLSLILFMLLSITGVGAFAVNLAKSENADREFNAVATLMLLAGAAVSVVSTGAYAVVLYHACMESVKQGLMTLFIPFYLYYYGFSRFETAGKPLIVGIIASCVGGGLLVGASIQMGR